MIRLQRRGMQAGAVFHRQRFTAAAAVLLLGVWLVPLHSETPVATGQAAGATRWSTAEVSGVKWLRAPDGQPFYSKGVNIVNGGQENAKRPRGTAFHWRNFHPSVAEWRQSARRRLIEWGFNTRGGWSDSSRDLALPLTVELDLGRYAKLHWFDPFDPHVEAKVRDWAVKLIEPYRDDPHLIGYFTDNEVGWWNAPLFNWYLKEGWSNYTKRVLWELLHEQYGGSWGALLRDWVPAQGLKGFDDLRRAGAELKLRPGGQGIGVVNRFTYLVARRYYGLVHDALRAADPKALILGDRLPLYYHQDAVRAIGDYVDVVSTNYNVDGEDGWVAPFYFEGLARLTDKPVLVTEFFFAAHENRTGNRNSGHLMTVATQSQRADGVANALRHFAGFPNVVGAHWFQYADEPYGGRDDGEDYNMGLIDVMDGPYEQLTEVFRRRNPALDALHARSAMAATGAEHADTVARVAAGAAVTLSDRSLVDWDKACTRLSGFSVADPYVPFADVHLSWSPEGLSLAALASNYVDLNLLAYDGAFPLSETFQLHLLVGDDDGEVRHFAVHLVPAPSPHYRERLEIEPELYRYENGVPGAKLSIAGHVQKLPKPLPHIAFEVFLPAAWLGSAGLKAGDRLRMNIMLVSYYRELTMSWVRGARLDGSESAESLRSVVLEAPGGAPDLIEARCPGSPRGGPPLESGLVQTVVPALGGGAKGDTATVPAAVSRIPVEAPR